MSQPSARPSRLAELSARGVVGGCVAVLLFCVAFLIGQLGSVGAVGAVDSPGSVGSLGATQPLDLWSVVSAAACIFAAATALRGFGGLILRPNPDPVAAVGVDLGLCVAALLAFAGIGSLANTNGSVLLTAMAGAPFVLIFAFIASIVCELAAHFAWIARAALIGGLLAALAALVLFALSIASPAMPIVTS